MSRHLLHRWTSRRVSGLISARSSSVKQGLEGIHEDSVALAVGMEAVVVERRVEQPVGSREALGVIDELEITFVADP